ncbi:MAG: alpha/beta hydrolase [Chloroflexi bacterium]|nr:alpha/beta hydrolase [Chloroflexota bacterium]
MTTFVLIHSPRVGALTWPLVADELRRAGQQVIVPNLFVAPDQALPYWQQHANAVAQAVTGETLSSDPILVAHSGAGPLLPAIEQILKRPIGGSIFVDAGLPRNSASRLELFGFPDEVRAFRASAVDGILPNWTSEDLREVIPDDAIREAFVADLPNLPLAVYEEPLPVFSAWPDAPCAYLHFSAGYDLSAQQAQALGWPYRNLEGGHFHMLVDAPAVAVTLLELATEMIG